MQLFYNSEISENTTEITFDKIESRHIIRVLRKTDGDILHITNGKHVLFEAQITFANDKKCIAKIIKCTKKKKTWNYYLHIAIAPTKNNDRLEWFLEKATEIGIDEITPIICNNSERRTIKVDRLEKIIQSALKQSLKFSLPKLNKPVKFKEFINRNFDEKLCIAHCQEFENSDTILEKKPLKSVVKTTNSVIILIGPEGDFTKEEIKLVLAKNGTSVSLGANRLRTETAGVVAVNTMSIVHT